MNYSGKSSGGEMDFPQSFAAVTPKNGVKLECGSNYHGFPSWQNPDGSRKVESPVSEGSETRNYLGNPQGGKP